MNRRNSELGRRTRLVFATRWCVPAACTSLRPQRASPPAISLVGISYKRSAWQASRQVTYLAFRDGVAQLIAAITEHSLHLAAAAATAAAAAATVGTNWRRCRLAATGYGSLSLPLCR